MGTSEKISNLNSFYYVRFDNGILAPLLAWITVTCFTNNKSINFIWISTALIIGIILVSYIPRIRKEIKIYNGLLKELKQKENQKQN